MLLTITYTGVDTTNLGYLLYKNPYRPQMFELSHGKAYVFYPEASEVESEGSRRQDGSHPARMNRGTWQDEYAAALPYLGGIAILILEAVC